MATHLIIRDGSLIPIANTYFTRNGNTINFYLADGTVIPEIYNTGEAAAIAAYALYVLQVTGSTPFFYRLIDQSNGALTTVYVADGILKVVQ